MPNINITIEDDLMRRIKVACAFTDTLQKDLVVSALEEYCAKVNSGGLHPSDNREVLPKPDERTNPIAHRPDVAGGDEAADSGTPLCPDDGDPLVWNRVLSRWMCACGYQGKVQKR
jgi:hypothetical protein